MYVTVVVVVILLSLVIKTLTATVYLLAWGLLES